MRRRTSEHWWEDEEEYDGVAWQLLPKTLHVVSVPRHHGAELVAAAAKLLLTGPVNAPTFAGGFCSPQVVEVAQALWERMGQAGPPHFKKMRQRATMGSMAATGKAAAQELLSELLSQNWRVELDYGLAGAELEPCEHLLLVAPAPDVDTLLTELLLGQDVGLASGLWQDVVLINVDVQGWNSPHLAMVSWRDLQPTLSNTCSRQPV